jgi:preprotein translocase subunit SecA
MFRSLFRRETPSAPMLEHVNSLRAEYARLTDPDLDRTARTAATLPEVVAVAAVLASRVLGLQMFDEQIAGALALAGGRIVEMQTGEGKTLAAVPAVAWLARGGRGVHVLTANDYLAQRDADWMRGIYERLGFSVAAVGQHLDTAARRAAYRAAITYTTANEVGFDYLRDGLAFDRAEQVHRPFAAALVDEADSILIDEARIPLVIAGGDDQNGDLVTRADQLARELLPGRHFTVDGEARNIALTPPGVAHAERGFGCDNLFDAASLDAHTALQDALHAHVLLRRDVDYIVTDDAVLPVDEFKGRIVPDRRWPAGLQTALEAKERVRRNRQGRVLGSITVEHLIALYPIVCGMTGTAATQVGEFRDVYGLDVCVIPPHRPVARVDHPDEVFASKAEKEIAVRDEIRRTHATGRPVLVGTSSVEESERLSRALRDVPHDVLNARHAAKEAAIIARAGERGAVTISTNMAGRGVDIRLGAGVAALGGLHVIGTNRHESRRIDHQLRGRAGRQGDPGSSRFFISREDPLVVKYSEGDAGRSSDQLQRIAEGQTLGMRLFLRKYESVIEGQRLHFRDGRQAVLDSSDPDPVRLATLDDLWADYLAAITELRSGSAWISMGYADPFRHYLQEIHTMFSQMDASIEDEVAARRRRVEAEGLDAHQRGATWTYLSTDEPFGTMSARILRNIAAMLRHYLGLP